MKTLLAGRDGPGRPGLPAAEFLHPAPLLALVVLGVNDHVLKGAEVVPGWLTGKLSDFAGLFFFPLLLTAIADTLAFAAHRLGLRCDFTLRRWKLALAIAVTGAAFAALKLSPAFAAHSDGILRALGFSARTTLDSSDLVALVMLVFTYRLGRAHIRGVPYGRIEWIASLAMSDAHSLGRRLADVRRLQRDPEVVDLLSDALADHLSCPTPAARARVDALLARLRLVPEPRGR